MNPIPMFIKTCLVFFIGASFFLFILSFSMKEDPITYEKDIKPLLEMKCKSPICHNSDYPPDFKNYRWTKRQGKRMAIRVMDTYTPMPPEDAEQKITEEEKKLILLWVAQGMPER